MNIKDLMQNKLFKLLIAMVAVVGVIIIVILVAMSLTGGRVSSYSMLEEKLISAAKNYYENNKEELPGTIGRVVEVDASTLSSKKYMKSIDKLAPKGSACTGKVKVKNVNNGYFYQAFVNCGDSYTTTVLSDYIKSHVSITGTGVGLYENNGNYIYRGENPNNYIKFADRVYRIVKVNNDSTIEIIANEKTTRVSWDDRYNQERNNDDGINNYSVSRIRDSLLAYVNSDSFDDEERSMLEPYNLCIAKLNGESEAMLGTECSEVLENQIVGLLPISSFMYASTDTACKRPLDGSCQNYNYLVTDYNWWTLTADALTTYKVFAVNSKNSAYITRGSSSASMREVLRITENAVYVKGNGTETDPYVIK